MAQARNPKDCDGNTPLHFAVENGHNDIFDLIVDSIGNMEINPINFKGFVTPLHLAAKKGNSHVCNYYLDIDSVDRYEFDNFVCPTDINLDTPLHFAARLGHFEICKNILKHVYNDHGTDGVEYDKIPRNNNGDTPLSLATKAGHNEVATLIMEYQLPGGPCEYTGMPCDDCLMTACQVPDYLRMPIETIFDTYHNFGFMRQNDGQLPNKRAKLNNGGSGGSAGGSNQMTSQRLNQDGLRGSAGGSNQMAPQSSNHDSSGGSAGGSNQMTPQRLNHDGSGGSAGGSNQMTPQRLNHDDSGVFVGGSNQLTPQRLNHDDSGVFEGDSNQMTAQRSNHDGSRVSAGGFNHMTPHRLNYDGSRVSAGGSNQMTPQGLNHDDSGVFVSGSNQITPQRLNHDSPGSSAGGSNQTTPQRLNHGGSGVSAGGSNQMSPQTTKHKCRDILAVIRRLADKQSPAVAENVRNLIQGLIDGVVDPETFCAKLTSELGSSPPPSLMPFLKRSLPFLQNSLISGELFIDGILPPSMGGATPTNPAVQTDKHKLRDFLASLNRVAETKSLAMAENVRNLIQSLIDGVSDPETFTTRLQQETNFSPLPGLLPFLKRSLPFLQNSLISGELSIDGIQPGIWINHNLL